MRSSADSLLILINDILDITRIESGPRPAPTAARSASDLELHPTPTVPARDALRGAACAVAYGRARGPRTTCALA